jgi:hypothetical protein
MYGIEQCGHRFTAMMSSRHLPLILDDHRISDAKSVESLIASNIGGGSFSVCAS